MAKLCRHKMVTVGGLEVRLKRWSISKLLLLVKEFWGLIEKAIESVDAKDSEVAIVSRLMELFLQSEESAARLIKWSIDEPKLEESDILEWEAGDFVGVLSEVIEFNVHEDAVKNFRKLLAAFARGREVVMRTAPAEA